MAVVARLPGRKTCTVVGVEGSPGWGLNPHYPADSVAKGDDHGHWVRAPGVEKTENRGGSAVSSGHWPAVAAVVPLWAVFVFPSRDCSGLLPIDLCSLASFLLFHALFGGGVAVQMCA